MKLETRSEESEGKAATSEGKNPLKNLKLLLKILGGSLPTLITMITLIKNL